MPRRVEAPRARLPLRSPEIPNPPEVRNRPKGSLKGSLKGIYKESIKEARSIPYIFLGIPYYSLRNSP